MPAPDLLEGDRESLRRLGQSAPMMSAKQIVGAESRLPQMRRNLSLRASYDHTPGINSPQYPHLPPVRWLAKMVNPLRSMINFPHL